MPRTPPRRLYADVFAISLAAIVLEIAYTRVFSFKLFYYFTYLIIGIALLGLGAGGVLVALSARLRSIPAGRLVPWCAVLAAGAVGLGYPLIAGVPLNAIDLVAGLSAGDLTTAGYDLLAFLAICGVLQVPFLAAGIALASVFAHHPLAMGRLYAADLVGAALGCAICVPLLATLGAPATILAAGGVLALCALRRGWLGPVAAVVAALLAAGVVRPELLPDPIPDRIKTMHPEWEHRRPVHFSRWHPVFRVDVMESPFDPNAHILMHDGMWGSLLHRWDGDVDSLDRFRSDPRALPFRILPNGARVAVIGAAGGNEILASLYFGASRVTAIELNPVTVSLLRSTFADYTGHLDRQPGVRIVNAEGRSFLRREESVYDLLWLVAPDSYAAMNAASSGAFVLSESYLYTDQMIRDGLARLTPGGVICTQFGEVSFEHKPNRTLRYLRTARAAFAAAGLPDLGRHALVSTAPSFGFTYSTIILSKRPLSAAEVNMFEQGVARIEGARVQYAPGRPNADPRLAALLEARPEMLAAWDAAQPFALGPVTDDAPFFWHFVRFRDALGRGQVDRFDFEDATGERLLMLLLAIGVIFAAGLLLLPVLAHRRTWHAVPYKGRVGLYFAALGLGFLFVEITLIQRLTLFLGYPTYSLTVTLFSILLSTGAGSAACSAYAERPSRTLPVLLGTLLALLALYQVGLAPLLARAAGAAFETRVLIAVLTVAPLGFCLGWFLPLGVRCASGLGEHGELFVAWGWAVNGFFSVLSSVLATMVAMAYGFGTVLLSAGAIYAIGVAALLTLPLDQAAAAAALPAEQSTEPATVSDEQRASTDPRNAAPRPRTPTP